MMLVTTAPNDEDLRVLLKKQLGGEVVFANIPHGDVNCFGVWENGGKCKLLFERKKLGDLISCIESGRYLDQWQRARGDGGWLRQYLFAEIERRYREGPRSKMVEVIVRRNGRGKWEVRMPEMEWWRIEAFLMEVEEYLGVIVVRTRNVQETAKAMVRRHQLFQVEPERHNSLKKIFCRPEVRNGEDGALTPLEMFQKPSTLIKVATQLHHIGWELSRSVEDRFGSIKKMANANVEEWIEIPKIGKKVAGDVVEEINKDWRKGR